MYLTDTQTHTLWTKLKWTKVRSCLSGHTSLAQAGALCTILGHPWASVRQTMETMLEDTWRPGWRGAPLMDGPFP